MEHLTISLDMLTPNYLEKISHLPIYTSNGRRVLNFTVGKRFKQGCIHESCRAAEKCCHDCYDWANADEVLIVQEGF